MYGCHCVGECIRLEALGSTGVDERVGSVCARENEQWMCSLMTLRLNR